MGSQCKDCEFLMLVSVHGNEGYCHVNPPYNGKSAVPTRPIVHKEDKACRMFQLDNEDDDRNDNFMLARQL